MDLDVGLPLTGMSPSEGMADVTKQAQQAGLRFVRHQATTDSRLCKAFFRTADGSTEFEVQVGMPACLKWPATGLHWCSMLLRSPKLVFVKCKFANSICASCLWACCLPMSQPGVLISYPGRIQLAVGSIFAPLTKPMYRVKSADSDSLSVAGNVFSS